jgi:AraC family ethanolamine operon transcriptional activator
METQLQRHRSSDARWHPGLTSQTLYSDDLGQHASSLQEWSQRYEQISRGRFSGMLTEAWAEGIQIFEERLSQAVFQTAASRPGTIAFGVIAEGTQEVRWQGRSFGPDQVSCIPVRSEAVMSTPPDSVFVGMCLPLEHLDGLVADGAASRREQLEGLRSTSVVHSGLAAAMRLRIGLALETLTCRPQQLEHEAARRQFFSDIVAMADEYIAATRADEDSAAHAKARKVVVKARDFLMANPERPITVLDLCSHTYTSRRTLQYCFEEVVGVSPAAFLKTMRLNGVRRDLAETAGSMPIGDVAARWGFWHLSQFSVDYKKLFGELPSATVRRASGAKIIST